MTDSLQHLGKQSQDPVDQLDLIPWDGGRVTVQLNCTEFSSHCPVTQQPDYGQLTIEYVPAGHLIETKSMKLYLWRYRDRRQFNEKLVDEIAKDIYEQARPIQLRVTGEFNVRGGIAVTCVARYGDAHQKEDNDVR